MIALREHASPNTRFTGKTDAIRSIIDIDGVCKTYDTASGEQVNALHDVNLHIGAGEFVCVVGASGCGKTTLLRLIAGLEKITNGSIQVNGSQLAKPSRDVGVVFQDATLLPWRTILQNVLLPAAVLKLEPKTHDERARQLLGMVGLQDFLKKYPHELSGGMRQRAAIARSLVHDPAMLLMDEPFGALDALTREQMNLDLLDIWNSTGKTILLITHSISEAVFLADRVVVMSPRPGRVVDVIPIDLERPRRLEMINSERFGSYVRHIRSCLGGNGNGQ
ncbi:ABC transporter ATP-binding protein [Stutzerimonas azotifigens]|uniref:ABC transporter ATP-binding protein n=1 Tax=Stutzerimonas azotifigens TaxID=291995 RepID=UPI000428F112|nr:ABC transporter ATP-binding protein [Stutzerimonas azotifigens]